jgi:hypothetical protein
MIAMKKAMIGAALGATALLATAGVAHADPTGSKNSLTLPATCGGHTVILVVNSANGQGAGAQTNNTAPFAPAHVVGSNAVFHPTAFNLTFTFTGADGESNSFLNQNTRKNADTSVECRINYTTPPDSDGNTFGLAGTVLGYYS